MGIECAPLLAALHEVTFRGGEVWDATSFAALLSGCGTEATVAVFGTVPAGFILARTILDETEILTLAVHPDFRRRGIGKSLVQNVLGKGKVFLEVSVCNIQAAALYEKCGFVKAGLRRGYYRDGSDAQVLVSSNV
ncbi:GNAT family N-acetyltransferase [Gluconobacter aidae]|uniref:GNAT family N-acetyltransferase n=1 Tax=Gluconobacter aidae TaxID=2662454 RepID=A0A7X1SPR0_9PROT|nr:GNAT family N-acetyltransferase [Gluconobacter aidae]MQR98049.1 GNAT family N-acetyltransferase [Gluconobacter aidae]